MKNTIIVNLFAGPGAGKSTGAAYIFSKLKLAGIDCEYVSEFAKDKVWEKNDEVFKNQFYITGKQSFKISRCFGKVEVIITDSPIALGALYAPAEQPMLRAACLEDFEKYNKHSLNIFINRVKAYNPNGRNQTEGEAKEIDGKTSKFLEDNRIPYIMVDGNEEGYDKVVDLVKNEIRLEYNKNHPLFPE